MNKREKGSGHAKATSECGQTWSKKKKTQTSLSQKNKSTKGLDKGGERNDEKREGQHKNPRTEKIGT